MSELLDRIRAQAMSDEGISDDQMAAFQQEKLEKIAAKDGGAAAIRAAMKPKAKGKPKAAAKLKGKTGPLPEGTPDPEWLQRQQRGPVTGEIPAGTREPEFLQRAMAEEESLGNRNYEAVVADNANQRMANAYSQANADVGDAVSSGGGALMDFLRGILSRGEPSKTEFGGVTGPQGRPNPFRPLPR